MDYNSAVGRAVLCAPRFSVSTVVYGAQRTARPTCNVSSIPTSHQSGVEYADDPRDPLRWKELGTVLITQPPQVFVDVQSPVNGTRLYRVVLVP